MSDTNNPQHIPSVAEVEQIRAVSDPAIRNLQITQCYHELSAVLAARTGVCANWCTFATWASKQAGQTIRKEDFARTLERVLGDSAEVLRAVERLAATARQIGARYGLAEIKQVVWKALDLAGAIERASDAVGRGNRKVFEEIGREFARFIAVHLHDADFDGTRLARFCDELRAGDPPDGQHYLRQAFTHYYQSFFAADARTRAELLLLANLEIGLHEQTRLQPEIAAALNAALVDAEQFKERLIKTIFPYGGWLVRARLLFKRLWGRPTLFDIAVNTLIAEVQGRLRLTITEHLLTLALGHDLRLRLGDDLRAEFPASVKQLVNPDLCVLLARVDPTLDSLRETGTLDWADLPERMHFIADLFRCHQESPGLFASPFTTAQAADLKAGRLPDGRL